MSARPRPVVLITGASSGIGAACAHVFAADGWDVAAAARREDRLNDLARQVRSAAPGATVLPIACDVNSDASVAAAFAALTARFGRLDALVNNAGYGAYGTVADTPLAVFRENMETNYFGALRCTQAALPLLRTAAREPGRRFWPAIVMVSSFVGRRGLPAMGAYCATKFALEGVSESLRVELADQDLSVSVINPGVTRSEFFLRAAGERPKGYLPPEHGMPAAQVARRILRAVYRPRRNVYLTLAGKAGMAVQWLCPSLLDFVLKHTWQGWARRRTARMKDEG